MGHDPDPIEGEHPKQSRRAAIPRAIRRCRSNSLKEPPPAKAHRRIVFVTELQVFALGPVSIPSHCGTSSKGSWA
jgi:hypothetical protein